MLATSKNANEILGFVAITVFRCPLEVTCPQFSGPFRPQGSFSGGIDRGDNTF